MGDNVVQTIGALAASSSTLLIFLFLITRAVKADIRFCSPIGAIVLRSSDDDFAGIRLFGAHVFLFIIYIGYSLAIAISGGTVGANLLSGVFEGSEPNVTAGGLNIVFCGALVTTALARWCAVYVSAAFGTYFQYLAAWILATLVFFTIADNDSFWKILGILNSSNTPEFFWNWLIYSLTVFGIVEGSIKLCSQWQVPYSLLTERIEEGASIKQVFGGKRITEVTDKILIKHFKSAELSSLNEFLWVTNEPPEHLDAIMKGLTSRTDQAFTETEARDWVKRKSRVIVSPNAINRGRVSNAILPWRIREGKSCFRVRFMVLTRKKVIVHLPMPFHGKDGERANVLYIISSPPQVSIWINKFFDLNSLLDYPKATLLKMHSFGELPGVGAATEKVLGEEIDNLITIAEWSSSEADDWIKRFPKHSKDCREWPEAAECILAGSV